MAWYQDGSYLKHSTSTYDCWTKIYGPGDTVPVSGIYKCLGCNKEITSNKPDKFPPQNNHQHTAAQGEIEWKLIVRTNTEGKNS